MTALASAIPAGSAPAAFVAAEPLRERLGDRGRAVGAADQRGGDGPVALAENAVGDIAEEREAGDEHDHQPQFLRVPRAERPVMAAGQERQHRAGDDRVPGERLDVLLVEPVDEAVQFVAQRQQRDRHRRAGDRQPGLADPGEEADRERDHRRHRAGRIVLRLELRGA